MLHEISRRNSLRQTSAAIACVLLCMVVCMMFTGFWPWTRNYFNSYTLQACSWLEGRLDLGQDYPHLELAIYEGKYYVSFPPFPSIILLPFAYIWGKNTPDGWISLLFTIAGIAYAIRLYSELKHSSRNSLFWVVFLYLGSGYIFIALTPWVWFFAQTMCFTLALAALYYSVKGRGILSLTAWACAVGCRPMTALFFPVLAWNLWSNWHSMNPEQSFLRFLTKKLYWAVPPCLIAAIYMVLNYMRFGDPLQFGHDYLPEFTRLSTGQFSLSYVLDNLYSLIRLPRWEDGRIQIYTCEGFAFYLVDPFLTFTIGLWIYSIINRISVRHNTHDLLPDSGDRCIVFAVIPLLALTYVFILTMHHTMGGMQWGNRYLLDILPWLFFGMIRLSPKNDTGLRSYAAPLLAWGTGLSIIGTINVYLTYLK